MSVNTSPVRGVGYLRLTLFCHALLNELGEVTQQRGKLPDRRQALLTATDSLASSEGKSARLRSASDNAFASYEEERLLSCILAQKVAGISNRTRLTKSLRTIATPTTPQGTRLEETRKVKAFFIQLSRRASANVHFPENEMPEGVRRFVNS